MIRIAIVEDDDSYIRALTGYLEQYGEQHSLSFHTTIFHDGLDIVTDYKADYDIILMDIQMKHLDGMTTAEKIRKLDEDVSLFLLHPPFRLPYRDILWMLLDMWSNRYLTLPFLRFLEKQLKK